MTEQARNLSWRLGDEELKPTILIHDRDRKLPASFDAVFQSEGARVILTPLRAPKANAHAERWIGSCRRECLDWLLILSERQLQTVLDIYCEHYNHERPHRSRELRPPACRGDPSAVGDGQISRRTRLGGLINEYAREAA